MEVSDQLHAPAALPERKSPRYPFDRKDISPPSSGSKNKPSKKPAGKQVAPPKRQFIFNGLHGVISQKIVLFNIILFFVFSKFSGIQKRSSSFNIFINP
jgi:hypothetical protein